MIETKVPKDVRMYETNAIGFFTVRQLICVFVIVIIDMILSTVFIDFPLFGLHKKVEVSNDCVFWIFFIIDVCLVTFGWIKPMNMKIEKFLNLFITNNVLSPARKLPRASKFAPISVTFNNKEIKASKKRLKAAIKRGEVTIIPYEAKRE